MAPRSIAIVLGLVFTAQPFDSASAQTAAPPPPPPPAAAPESAPPAPPPPAAEAPAPALAPGDTGAAGASVAATAAAPRAPGAVQYGGDFRIRYIAVPKWLLGLFLAQSMPLSSYSMAGEFIRRKGDFDIVVAVGYQKLQPAGGNWLGKSKDPAVDTDFVQFPGFGMVSADFNFLWRREINPYFGFRYGAGLGLGVITGKITRISADNCTAANAGDVTQCKPAVCQGTRCTEAELKASEGAKDNGPLDPHRYKEPSVPGAIPIINLLVGTEFHIPEAKGLEFRIEGGYSFPAFVIGLTVGYFFN